MRLIKDQRFTAYCIMLEELEEYDGAEMYSIAHDGFCFLAFNLFELNDLFDGFDECLELFPEILSKKPEHSEWLWFRANCYGGTPQRIAILKQCIRETHP